MPLELHSAITQSCMPLVSMVVNVTCKISATLGSSSWNVILCSSLSMLSKYRASEGRRLHAGPFKLHPPRTLTFPSAESSYRHDLSERSSEVTIRRYRHEQKVRVQVKVNGMNVILCCDY